MLRGPTYRTSISCIWHTDCHESPVSPESRRRQISFVISIAFSTSKQHCDLQMALINVPNKRGGKAHVLESVVYVHDPVSIVDDHGGANDHRPRQVNRHVQQCRARRAMLQHGQAALLQLLVLSSAPENIVEQDDLCFVNIQARESEEEQLTFIVFAYARFPK